MSKLAQDPSDHAAGEVVDKVMNKPVDGARRTILKASASAALMGVGGLGAAMASRPASAQSGVFNYKVGTDVPLTHSIYKRLTEACDNIKKQTDGKVNIRVFPNGQLGSDTEMLSQLRSGGMDLLSLPGVVLANLVPMASLNSVGFAFPDYPTVWRAMDGKVGGHIRDQTTKAGLVVLPKIWDNGFRQITSNSPISTPTDLSNLKIRVPVSPLLLSLFKSLGSSPTPINFNELYSSLQTHVIDAQENALTIVDTAKIYEVQKRCALTSHVWDGYWLLANRRSWDALPTPLREIVDKNFDAAAVAQRADSEKLAIDLQKTLGTKGLTFNSVAAEPFRKKLTDAGFYKEWKDKFGAEAWGYLEMYSGKLG